MTSEVRFRRAVAADLPAVVALLRDDDLGAVREVAIGGEGTSGGSGPLAPYERAFADIDADPRHLLVVAELDGAVVGCVQLTELPCLTHGGRRRAQFEGVRVASTHRGRGIGSAMLRHGIRWARDQGCGVVQLTTDVRRPAAQRLYEHVGFEHTHAGLKLTLGP